MDPLEKYFVHLLHDSQFMDLDPIKLKPTWANKITGDNIIAKCIDRFLIAERLLNKNIMIRKWVDLGGEYDHLPIFLEI